MKKRRRYNIKTHRPSKTNKKKENGKRILFGIDLQSSKLHSHFLLLRVGNFFGSMLLTLFFFFCFFLFFFLRWLLVLLAGGSKSSSHLVYSHKRLIAYPTVYTLKFARLCRTASQELERDARE
jgi:hypothetical protein